MEIQWKDEYSVGLDEIDEQHRYFISLLNDLYKAIGSNKGSEELARLFGKLSEYADLHFATEEKYFDEFGYDGAEEHKAEHQKMRDEIQRIKKQESDNNIDFYGDIVYFLQGWLEDHLEKMDQKYEECFASHGVK